MELIKLQISHEFIAARTTLSWREVLFGLTRELIDPDVPIEMAIDRLGVDENPSRMLVDLAGLDVTESSRTYVEALARVEADQGTEDIQNKWLYLVLAWVFVHKDRYPDPLQMVEDTYADFGYPEDVARFVRYMPLDEPNLGTRELNEQRLYDKWQSYLNEMSARYAS